MYWLFSWQMYSVSSAFGRQARFQAARHGFA